MCGFFAQINFDLHVCLENSKGKDIDGSEKEAVIEVSLEYEWASQDDSKEVNQAGYTLESQFGLS